MASAKTTDTKEDEREWCLLKDYGETDEGRVWSRVFSWRESDVEEVELEPYLPNDVSSLPTWHLPECFRASPNTLMINVDDEENCNIERTIDGFPEWSRADETFPFTPTNPERLRFIFTVHSEFNKPHEFAIDTCDIGKKRPCLRVVEVKREVKTMDKKTWASIFAKPDTRRLRSKKPITWNVPE